VRPGPGDSDPFAVLKSRIGLGSELESLNRKQQPRRGKPSGRIKFPFR
jgi:hypothetical protein